MFIEPRDKVQECYQARMAVIFAEVDKDKPFDVLIINFKHYCPEAIKRDGCCSRTTLYWSRSLTFLEGNYYTNNSRGSHNLHYIAT